MDVASLPLCSSYVQLHLLLPSIFLFSLLSRLTTCGFESVKSNLTVYKKAQTQVHRSLIAIISGLNWKYFSDLTNPIDIFYSTVYIWVLPPNPSACKPNKAMDNSTPVHTTAFLHRIMECFGSEGTLKIICCLLLPFPSGPGYLSLD